MKFRRRSNDKLFIGYDATANIAKEGFSAGKTICQVSREHKVLPEKELNRVLDPIRLTKPGVSANNP